MEKSQLKFGKLRASYLLIALGIATAMGGYGWRLYALFRDSQLNMPQPQIEKLTKDLRIFHAKTGRFPVNFNEINDLIWHTRPTPDYGKGGRQARTKNYYYFYTRVKENQCAIWALPMGPQRQYASSFFLVLTPDWLRAWKGAALDDEKIEQLAVIPHSDQLATLGMAELPARVIAGRNESSH